jgi:glucose-1-phosphate thymidylyltransferase
MHIAILAAGYGTRLYPLTLKIAKPLLPINGKPMLNFLIDKIDILKNNFAIEETKIIVNNKFYRSFLGWKKKYDINAQIINDGSNSNEERRGATKDMKLAIADQKKDWLILGGDNLFEDDLVEFIKFSLRMRPYSSIGLYDVKSKKEATRFGVVVLNKRKKIVEFQEKPKRPASTLAASCVYFFPKESVGLLNIFISQYPNNDAAGKYVEWLAKESKVFGYTLGGKWIDIGHQDSLKQAEGEFGVIGG